MKNLFVKTATAKKKTAEERLQQQDMFIELHYTI